MHVHPNSNTDYKITNQWKVRIASSYRELEAIIEGALPIPIDQ